MHQVGFFTRLYRDARSTKHKILLSSTAKLHSCFEGGKKATQLTWPRIRRSLCPLYSSDWTPCDSFLWGRLKDNVYTTNPHTLEELRYHIRRQISTIAGEELQRVNNSSALVLSEIDQEGNIFSISFSLVSFC